MEEEELFNNPVYVGLTRVVPNLEARAGVEGWIIMLPQLISLEGIDISALQKDHNLLKQHVLRPSPLLKDLWVGAFNSSDQFRLVQDQLESITTKEVENEDKGNHADIFVTSTVKILYDEVFYTRNGSFVAYCVDKPLGLIKRKNKLRGSSMFNENYLRCFTHH